MREIARSAENDETTGIGGTRRRGGRLCCHDGLALWSSGPTCAPNPLRMAERIFFAKVRSRGEPSPPKRTSGSMARQAYICQYPKSIPKFVRACPKYLRASELRHERAFECGLQRFKACRDLARKMDSQRAPATFEENVKVAAGLRIFHNAETGAVSGNGDVLAVVGGDLEKHTAVRTALVSLAGRVQKSRAEFEAGCDPPPVAQRQAQVLQTVHVLFVARKIGEQRETVAVTDPRKMRGKPTGDGLAGSGFSQRVSVRGVGKDRKRLLGAEGGLRRQFAGRFKCAR